MILVQNIFSLPCGVPQGSSLSPKLFNQYVNPLADVIRQFGFSLVSYAVYTQIVVSISGNLEETAASFNQCMTCMDHWMRAKCLKLNGSKTEVLLLGSDSTIWSQKWWPPAMEYFRPQCVKLKI